MIRIAPILLASLAVLAAGCGSSNDTKTTSQPAAPAKGATVIKMQNISFAPKEQAVKVGKPVTWENEDDVPHNVVARQGADFSSDTFSKGGTFSYTPKKAGKIEYTCTLHPGMDAELTVTG